MRLVARSAGTEVGASRPQAGQALAWLTVLPGLLVAAWLIPGVSLLAAGRFMPLEMILIAVPLAAALLIAAGRHVPGRWVHWPRSAGQGRDGNRGAAAIWGLAGTAAVAGGFAAWQVVMNSPQVIVARSPGAAFQAGYWIAQFGSLPIPEVAQAFGGSHPGLAFTSPGFAQHGAGLVPSQAAGLPIVAAAGFWVHGISAAALVSPVLGALAILSFGGLAARLAGPGWAPAAAAVLALTLPEVYTSRSAFSEPLVQVLLFGGLCLFLDSLTGAPSRISALLGGVVLGLAVTASPLALLVLLPVIPVAGVLVAIRHPVGYSFGIGIAAGAGYSLVGGYLLGSYLGTPRSGWRELGLAAAGFAVVTVVALAVAGSWHARQRVRRVLSARPLRWLPEAAAVVCVVVLAAFAARPYAQTVLGPPDRYVAALQRIAGLRVQPRRLYAEDSLYWVIWYLGVPAVLLGGLGLALLARRCVRALLTGRDPGGMARAWALPLMMAGWAGVVTLWRPGTVPDQPWASRRLVMMVLPGLILGAVWAAAWLADRARELGAGQVAVSGAALCFTVALALPAVVTTAGISFSAPAHSGGLALGRVGVGELAAVRQLCGAIGRGAAVVIVDEPSARAFAPVVRGMCDDPTGIADWRKPAGVRAVLAGIERAGGRPVLLAASSAELRAFRVHPRRVLGLATSQDPHTLTTPPAGPWRIRYVLWLASPGRTAGT